MTFFFFFAILHHSGLPLQEEEKLFSACVLGEQFSSEWIATVFGFPMYYSLHPKFLFIRTVCMTWAAGRSATYRKTARLAGETEVGWDSREHELRAWRSYKLVLDYILHFSFCQQTPRKEQNQHWSIVVSEPYCCTGWHVPSLYWSM